MEASGLHKVYTHGGQRILIRLPDLFTLIQEDAVPEHLRGVALREIETGSAVGAPAASGETGSGVTWDTVKEAAELYEHISYAMVVQPQVTLEQFKRWPAQDRDMLRDLAMRSRDTDARGVKLGVEPLERWAEFRDAHGCPEGCTSCAQALDAVSTLGHNAL